MKGRRGKIVRCALECAIFALIGWLFARTLDFRQLRAEAALLSPLLVLGVFGFQAGILALGSLCWALLLKEAGIYRGAWRTFWARVSGFAVTYLVPPVTLGGVPARAKVYQDSAMEAPRLYATVALDTFLEVAGKAPCVVVGLALASPAAAVIFISAALGVLALVRLLGRRTSLIRMAKRLLRLAAVRPRRAAAVLFSLRRFVRSLQEVVRHRRVLGLAFAVATAIALLEVAQTFFILRALDCPSLAHSFVIFSSLLFQGVVGVLPGNLGGMEGAHLFVFSLLGIGAEKSLLYTAILRLGQVSMTAVGMANILRWRMARRAPPRALSPGAKAAVARRSIV